MKEHWRGPAARLKLRTHSERMFRTQLRNAAQRPPAFAGRYTVAAWGCGSECAAGAIIDLRTGAVYPPPLGGRGLGWERWIYCSSMAEGNGLEYRPDSRLMVLRCGWNHDKEGQNHPDVYHFVWEGNHLRQLLHIRAPKQKW